MILTEEQIIKNWETFNSIIDKMFPTRSEKIHQMNEALGIERIASAPASSQLDFHNCFAGGYVDHVLRVIKFSLKMLKTYEDMGLDVSDISKEELFFVAMHHDLGKLGLPGEGNAFYIPNTSKWHVDNQGKVFSINPAIPSMPIQDRSLYLLQSFGITCNNKEWIAIKTHDSLYDVSNDFYMKSHSPAGKFRSNLCMIIQMADQSAWIYEFERYMKSSDAPITYSQFKKEF